MDTTRENSSTANAEDIYVAFALVNLRLCYLAAELGSIRAFVSRLVAVSPS